MIREVAPAKANLVLQVGPMRDDGLHEICSLFASLDLTDDVVVREAATGADEVVCPGVVGPNICHAALRAIRAATDAAVPPLEVFVDKHVPVAAGLGGGSADAAAVLRAANAIAGDPLDAAELRRAAASVGADVPSQVEPGHAIVQGAGEIVEPVSLPAITVVLVPAPDGLATADVYAEADRLGATRPRLAPDAVRAAARGGVRELAASAQNDLEPAALSLRPEVAGTLEAVRVAGAIAALVSGSGPTVIGLFEDDAASARAAAGLPGALAVGLR